MIKAHNRLRAEASLPPLELARSFKPQPSDTPRTWLQCDKMSHKGSDGSSSIHRIIAKGYNTRAGEKHRRGLFTVDGLMKGWMESPHHKRNILGSFSQIGVACATGENGKRYWCVTFGLPARR